MKNKPPFLRTAYNYDMNEAGDESGLECLDKTLTKQSFADEVDINTIVERFHITGELPTNVRMPTYQDFTGIFDFHSAMNAIAQANEAFDKMPAAVRARFHNDPAEFVEFCSKDENHKEAAKMGLLTPEAVEQLRAKEAPSVAPSGPVGASTGADPAPASPPKPS